MKHRNAAGLLAAVGLLAGVAALEVVAVSEVEAGAVTASPFDLDSWTMLASRSATSFDDVEDDLPITSGLLNSPDGPLSLCFLPGTPEHIMAQVHQAMIAEWNRNGGGMNFNADARWSGVSQGSPLTLRWSIVPDGLNIPNAFGEGAGASNFQARMVTIFGSYENGLARVRQVFDRWSELTGITYIEVSDDGAQWGAPGPHNGFGGRGDIRIAMKPFAGQFNGVLAYNYFPDNGDMVMNSGQTNYYSNSSNNYRRFRNVVAHEHGHGMGMNHVCPQNSTKLMEPAANNNFDGPQHDDIRGGQRGYGDRYEHNDAPGTATHFGALGNGLRVENNLSIDNNFEVDFYRFTVPAGKQVSVTVIPIGFTYQDWDQNEATGQCFQSGPTVNSLIIHNLHLQLRDVNGNTVLVDMNQNPAGQPETISQYVLPSAGTFFIRVSGGTTNDVQMYDMQILIEDAPPQEGFVEWTTYTTVSGVHQSGGLAEFLESDDQHLVIRSQFGFTALEPNINEVSLIGTSPFTSVSRLDLGVESRVNQANATASIRLRNQNTSVMTLITSYPLEQTDTLFEFENVANPQNYVRAADGAVEIRVRNHAIATFTALGFTSRHDWVYARVVP